MLIMSAIITYGHPAKLHRTGFWCGSRLHTDQSPLSMLEFPDRPGVNPSYQCRTVNFSPNILEGALGVTGDAKISRLLCVEGKSRIASSYSAPPMWSVRRDLYHVMDIGRSALEYLSPGFLALLCSGASDMLSPTIFVLRYTSSSFGSRVS